MRWLGLALVAFALASCAQRPGPRDVYARVLARAPGAAQPSRIVAREIEFLKRAREIGQFKASLEFAAPDAIMISATGEVDAATSLPRLDEKGLIAPWKPSIVWMSCDGEFAVSEGRFDAVDGKVGTYLTTWQRGQNGEYYWLHNSAALDNPQPPAKAPEPELAEDAIVVEGLAAVEGRVADCTRDMPAPPAATSGLRQTVSPDRTLVWRWGTVGGARVFEVHALTEGEWRLVVEKRWQTGGGK